MYKLSLFNCIMNFILSRVIVHNQNFICNNVQWDTFTGEVGYIILWSILCDNTWLDKFIENLMSNRCYKIFMFIMICLSSMRRPFTFCHIWNINFSYYINFKFTFPKAKWAFVITWRPSSFNLLLWNRLVKWTETW